MNSSGNLPIPLRVNHPTKVNQQISEPISAPPEPVGSETILVVEDEGALRGLIMEILRRYGYRTLEAASGVEALEIWESHGVEVDLVLTDMVMPGGVSGRDLAETLWRHRPDLKVIFSSGYSLEVGLGDMNLREGFNFLPKPYPPPTLARTIRQYLDSEPELVMR